MLDAGHRAAFAGLVSVGRTALLLREGACSVYASRAGVLRVMPRGGGWR
jgi:hypothetical protein